MKIIRSTRAEIIKSENKPSSTAVSVSTPIRFDAIYWILTAQALVIIPLLWQLPRWLWGLWALAIFWRYAAQKKWVNPSGNLLKWLLAGGAIAGWYFSFPQRANTDAMVGLLVMSFILKTTECQTNKDGLLLIFIGFIAVAAQFLFNQSLASGLYGAACLMALLLAWQSLYFTRERPLVNRVSYASILVLQALPLMLLLFVVMPRLTPLWKVPMPEARGKTGFSDQLSPGDLGQLVKSGETAFRANFIGEHPRPRDLYWRGLVLSEFDGRSWRRASNDLNIVEESPQSFDQLIEYSIVIEPHNQTWLFSLATPTQVKGTGMQIKKQEAGLVAAENIIFQRTQYQVISARSVFFPENSQLSQEERQLNLSLPKDGNIQTRALAQMWQKSGMDTQQKITAALELFNREFVYTLSPPVLGSEVVDEFLFSSKRGFCEHFASSFTFLMRAAGVPARVVVGYQGGKYNDLENYLIVTQADAHAWVEIWQQGFGWVMLDPTAAVAPNRIELGIDEALNTEDRSLVGQGVLSGSGWWLPWEKRWDAANFTWQRWVLNYDAAKQKNVLERWLGGSDWQSVMKGLFVLGVFFSVGFALWLYGLRKKPTLTEEARLLVPLYRKLIKKGFKPKEGESVMAFLNRVGQICPEYKIPARYVAKLFEQVVYASDIDAMDKLKRAAKQFPHVVRN
jgi:protein-glutamine gamma-glutamyltransferase